MRSRKLKLKKLYAVMPLKTGQLEIVEVDDVLRPPAGASKVHENFWGAWAEFCRSTQKNPGSIIANGPGQIFRVRERTCLPANDNQIRHNL